MAGVALVLGGGGLVGHAWHVGALAGLADATGWDPCDADLIVGTSAGAVVGAELRAGLHPYDLLRPGVGAAPTTPPQPALSAPSRRCASPAMAARAVLDLGRSSAGLVAAGLLPAGRRDTAIISDAISRLHPDTSGWPALALWVCAVRLDDGRRVVFHGDGPPTLATAVAASCAMPGYFAPVRVAGHDHVDGGARSATNADLAGGGFDLVVVSSPMSLDRSPDPRHRASRRLAAAARAHRLLHGARLRRELAAIHRQGTFVLTLEPGPGDLTLMGSIARSMDFDRRAAVVGRARETAARRVGASSCRVPWSILTAAAGAEDPAPDAEH